MSVEVRDVGARNAVAVSGQLPWPRSSVMLAARLRRLRSRLCPRPAGLALTMARNTSLGIAAVETAAARLRDGAANLLTSVCHSAADGKRHAEQNDAEVRIAVRSCEAGLDRFQYALADGEPLSRATQGAAASAASSKCFVSMPWPAAKMWTLPGFRARSSSRQAARKAA